MQVMAPTISRPYAFLLATATYSLIVSLIYLIYVYNHSDVVAESAVSPLRSEFYKWTQLAISRNFFQEIGDALGLAGDVTSSRQGVTFDVIHEGYRDMTYQPLKLACSSCAIVSSSGHLINTSVGAEIDSHPCIFRMNNAPTLGYERDVGSRTTVRSMGHVNLIKGFENSSAMRDEMFFNNLTRTDIVLINWMNLLKVDVYNDQDYRYALLLAHLYPNVRFYHFTPEKMNQTQELFKNETGIYISEANTWLSTGWFTMVSAMDICDEITVCGMAYDDFCNDNSTSNVENVPYHYYEPDRLKECQYYNRSETRMTGGHLFITEKAVSENWAILKKNIKFRYPEWPLTNATVNSLDTPFLHQFWAFVKEGGNMTELMIRKKQKIQRNHLKKAPPKTYVVVAPPPIKTKEAKDVDGKTKTVIITLQKGNERIKVNQDDLVDILVELLPDVKLIQTDEYVENNKKPVENKETKKKPAPKKRNKRVAPPQPPKEESKKDANGDSENNNNSDAKR